MSAKKQLLLVSALMICILLAAAGTARASQVPAHEYIALRALEQSSPAVKAIVGESNLDAYLAGSAGPDIAMAVYWLQMGLGWDAPGLEAHYERTGRLVTNMYELARNDRERAFVLGWLTHWVTDTTIHPLVSRYGGYYEAGKEAQIRHKTLEMFECAHIFNRWAVGDDLDLYILNPAAVPAWLVNAAYAKTYPLGWTTGRFKNNWTYYHRINLFDGPLSDKRTSFERHLPSGAESVRIFSEAVVQNKRYETWGFWGTITMRKIFPTPPPVEWECKYLMDPLNIKHVKWEEPDRENGETIGHIVITYEVNDLRLFKAFADDWDILLPRAIADSALRMSDLVSDPANYQLPDWNLEWGPDKHDENNPKHTWPGFPEIKDLLVKVSAGDRAGKPLRVLVPPVEDNLTWSPQGEWVPCPVADHADWEKYAGNWYEYTRMAGERGKVWGGPAGQATVRIPVDVPEPGALHVGLMLAFADMGAVMLSEEQRAEYYRKPYGKEPDGIHDTWSGILGAATILEITPDEILDGEAGKKYNFKLEAVDIPEEVRSVFFEWDFGDMGTWSKGESQAVSVRRGAAELAISHTYPAGKSECTITAVVIDLISKEELARAEAWISFSNVTIEDSRQIVYSLVGGATEVTHDFKAVAAPAGAYRFDWDFGDGKTFSETRQPGQSSQVRHTYTGLKSGDRFTPEVKLYNAEGQLLAKDAVTIRVEAESLDLLCIWEGRDPGYNQPVVVSIEKGTAGYDYDFRFLQYQGENMSDMVYARGRDAGGGIVNFEGFMGFYIEQRSANEIYISAPPMTLRRR